jgi:hypothetical protein
LAWQKRGQVNISEKKPLNDDPPDLPESIGRKPHQFLAVLNRDVPGLLALIMVVTYCIAVIFKIPVDEKFVWAISVILSFYFGSQKGGAK